MLKKIIYSVFAIIFALMAGYIINDYYKGGRADALPPVFTYVPQSSANSYKPQSDIQTVITKGIEESASLVTSEVDMVCAIKLNDSWQNLSLFLKEQNINFSGKAVYAVDLKGFTAENLSIDKEKYVLTAYLNKPYVYNISINAEGIEAEEVKNGLLRFGNIKLETNDMKALLQAAEEEMLNQAENSMHMAEAEIITEKALISLFSALLEGAGFVGYEVNIEYK
ncbi:DUF4230 domain-containing protein [Tyzzerella sp. OttesenSCG-928-J15]|nr:DUF4230 domain-containing protein [Tyzzerella sp. OttesenSCG-928-J15]